jgi:hypothetical protein
MKNGRMTYRLVRRNLPTKRWRVWYREPGGALVRPGFNGTILECAVISELSGKNAGDFLIAVDPNAGPDKSEDVISADDLDLESRLVKSKPISLMKRAMKRWIAGEFPAWDSPEPWLNKLWAGEVFSICNQMLADPQTGQFTLRNDSPDSLRYLWDIRWLRDASIGSRTLFEAAQAKKNANIDESLFQQAGAAFLMCQSDDDLQNMLKRRPRYFSPRSPKAKNLATRPSSQPSEITGYDAFLRWCRSFYVNNDFARLIDLRLSPDGLHVEKHMPVGVMDKVITTVLGLKDTGRDKIRIEPAKWIRQWPYFTIDNLPCRGHNLTVAWQSPKHTRRYRELDMGMSLFVDGRLVKQVDSLSPVEIELK